MAQGRYRHLSVEEREQIAVWRLEGGSQAEMARRLGRSSSTVKRELARCRLPSGGYQPGFPATVFGKGLRVAFAAGFRRRGYAAPARG